MSAPTRKKPRAGSSGRGHKSNARDTALRVLQAVLLKGRSLASAGTSMGEELEARDRAHAMELVYGVLRWRFRLELLLAKLLSRPLRSKDRDIELVLLLALYSLVELSTPDYAVVNEAVAQTRRSGKKWAASLVNAVLRNFIRQREPLLASLHDDRIARYAHPGWIIDALMCDWPDAAQQILEANNQRPPMWLRINTARVGVADYVRLLEAQQQTVSVHALVASAIKLDMPMDVSKLPGFSEGLVSVQDASAQLAAQLFAADGKERVLDVCAAPGGKTCNVLEMAPGIDMTAVELDPQRMQRVQQNLDRLGLQARLVVADAATDSWWDGRPFDRILVDAPCSASGVIRRHPDIKSLRQQDDLVALCELQQRILLQSWQMLKPGGRLLYVTCSVLKQENEQQMERLLCAHADAAEMAIEADWGHACIHGRQLLPGEMDGDGFYFACLKKQSGDP